MSDHSIAPLAPDASPAAQTLQFYVKPNSNCEGLQLQTATVLGPQWSGDKRYQTGPQLVDLDGDGHLWAALGSGDTAEALAAWLEARYAGSVAQRDGQWYYYNGACDGAATEGSTYAYLIAAALHEL